MRVCLVSQEYPPETAHGGIGTQTWNKAHALRARGHEVHVLSCRASQDAPGETVASGIAVRRIFAPGDEPGKEIDIYEQAVYMLGYTWSLLPELSRLLQSRPFDLVNFPEYGAEGCAFLLNRSIWNWVPAIVQLHGPLAMFAERIGWPDQESDYYRLATVMEGIAIRRADGWMASSANIANYTAQFYGIPRDEIHVVHCGIDCEMYRPAAAERRTNRPTVLFVGNMVANKGVELVLEAVLRLREKYPDILLRLVGRGDDIEKRYRPRVARASAEKHVEYAGYVEDRRRLPAIYNDADVFASPAHHEVGVANVYVEAMACGVPVVACSTGGAPEAVTDGVSGILAPPNDLEATTAALDRLLGDPGLRERMGEAGRRRAVEYFSVDRYIERVLAAYEAAIECSRRKLAQLRAEAA